MSDLIQMYKKLGIGDENDLIKTHLGGKIAGLINQSLHEKILYKDMKLEIEKIRNSQTVEKLSESAKNHVIEMCDKALKIVELNNQNQED